MRTSMITLTVCGAILGYIFAQAERRGFCTGYWSEATQTCRQVAPPQQGEPS